MSRESGAIHYECATQKKLGVFLKPHRYKGVANFKGHRIFVGKTLRNRYLWSRLFAQYSLRG